MNLQWDYTKLAAYYDKRADYSAEAIAEMLALADIVAGQCVADIGAGTGKLTRPLLDNRLHVRAVEPNDAMRAFGVINTLGRDVVWTTGTGEETGLPSCSTRGFFMGSSFNVVDQSKCLHEAHRVLENGGYFACMWNHRDLEDSLQRDIEALIKMQVPSYEYGKRREDPAPVIVDSGLFNEIKCISSRFITQITAANFLEGWKSHATLERQTGEKFDAIIADISRLIGECDLLDIPYTTNIWLAKRKG